MSLEELLGLVPQTAQDQLALQGPRPTLMQAPQDPAVALGLVEAPVAPPPVPAELTALQQQMAQVQGEYDTLMKQLQAESAPGAFEQRVAKSLGQLEDYSRERVKSAYGGKVGTALGLLGDFLGGGRSDTLAEGARKSAARDYEAARRELALQARNENEQRQQQLQALQQKRLALQATYNAEQKDALELEMRQKILQALKANNPNLSTAVADAVLSGGKAPQLQLGYSLTASQVLGSQLPTDVKVQGTLDPEGIYDLRLNKSTNQVEAWPRVGKTTSVTVNNNGQLEKVFIDQAGNVVGKPMPIYGGEKTATHEVIKDVNGKQTVVQLRTTSEPSKRTTSGQGSKAAIPATGASKPSVGPTESLGRILGDSSRERQNKLDAETLTPAAASQIGQTETNLALLKRVKDALKPYKNSEDPGTLLLPRIAYALGYDDEGKLLSQLDLGSLTQAATIARLSGSRAYQTLDRASLHTPQDWKDSGKLMWDKIEGIEQNMKDIIMETKKYGRKRVTSEGESPYKDEPKPNAPIVKWERGPNGVPRKVVGN